MNSTLDPSSEKPYGISNFRTIALEGYAYVDKTRFIRVLEEYPIPICSSFDLGGLEKVCMSRCLIIIMI
jgi:hypothetical protein